MKLKDSIIIILAVVIAIVVGVFVGFKLSEDKNDNLTMENVKELMDKYKVAGAPITDLSYSVMLDLIAINNSSGQTYECSDFYPQASAESSYGWEVYPGIVCLNNEFKTGIYEKVYSYSNVLQSKKELFGNISTLEKRNFSYVNPYFDYIAEKDLFVPLEVQAGGIPDQFMKIENFNMEKGQLHVNTTFFFNGEKTNEYKYIFKKQDTGYYLYSVEKQG